MRPEEKTRTEERQWLIKLFNKSVIKQRKYKVLTSLLGETDGLRCLDIGSDNGVISYLLRQRGGSWKSADLDPSTVLSITGLVGENVYQIDGQTTPFRDNEFDRVVIVDFLEHIPEDKVFIEELHRIIKPCGFLIVNTPHLKNSLLRRLRLRVGQTDEKHGHLRPGYNIQLLRVLLGEHFTVKTHMTYSKFFSELVDTLVVQAIYFLQRNKGDHSPKGAIVTAGDLQRHRSMFLLYSLIFPLFWLFSKLDSLLVFRSGYMFAAIAKVNKEVVCY